MSNLAVANPVKVMAGKLLGEFSLITSDGLRIPGMRLLEEQDGTHWVSFPCKEYVNKEGQRVFRQLVQFADDAARLSFEAEIVPLAERAIFGGAVHAHTRRQDDPMPWARGPGR
jgi:hypothetical protein